MTDRLVTAFAALAERGAVAGADAVWQRAVLAAAVDDRPALTDGGTPLVPVVRPGSPSAPTWVEVREDSGGVVGRRRVGLAVGLAAAALVGAGMSAVILRDGDDAPGMPGGPGEPTTMIPDTSAPTESTTFATMSANSETTFIGEVTDTTFGGSGSGFGFAIGAPCVGDGREGRGDDDTGPLDTSATATSAFAATTAVASTSGYESVCVYDGGTLPPVTDAPGADWMSAPTTLPPDASLAYWRMLDDLDITWRAETDGIHVYWRTPAGQGGAPDGIGGAAVLLIPATDRYIVLARAGATDGGAPGQRPLQARAILEDGTVVTAAIRYDNDLGLGYAYLDTTMPIREVAAR